MTTRHRVRGRVIGAALVLALGPSMAACTSSAGGEQVLTVAAASSLGDVMADLESAYPGRLRFTFAGSSTLAEQVRSGAPIDVFVSAGATSMQPLVEEGAVTDVIDIATNTMAIAVPVSNPGRVASLDDLQRVGVILCQSDVPCGVAADRLLERNGLTVRPLSREPDVRSVLAKVEADAVDAGIVYVTDIAAASGAVTGIDIPAASNVSTTYQAAVVSESSNAGAARDFVEFLATPAAQEILARAGFGPAP